MNKELKSLYSWLAIGGLVVLVATYFIVSLIQSRQDNLVFGSQTHLQKSEVAKDEGGAGFGPEVVKNSQPVGYEEVRDSYIGRRIQLDNCMLDPNTVTYKNGTKVMLDNRSSEPTEIKIDGKAIRFWGYEYKIVTLYNTTAPHTLDVDCEYLGEVQYNVARILLQP
ncbi:MAG: hypothetical protein HUU49_04415 [Candidatus Buchananbacteria bacterium]|nr:hypothetical protein [Candidatus Buchananbacteria bacterium]